MIKETINTVVGFFDFSKGELGEINKKIRELKIEYPEHVEKNLKKAEKVLSDLEFDRKFRNGQIGLEESKLNEILLVESEMILREKASIDESYKAEKGRLLEKKRNIENEIRHWQSRRIYMEGPYKSQMDKQVGEIQRTLKDLRYTVDRDRKYFISQLTELDAEIKELQAKQAQITGLEEVGLEMQVKGLELKKLNLMANQYPAAKWEFEDKDKRISQLEQQVKSIESNYLEGLQQCTDELVRLYGKQ